MTMIRTVVSPPTNGGKACQGEMTRQAECNIKPCTGDRGKRVSRFTDFDGDLRTDIALVGLVPASGAAQLPVAFSNGRQGVTVNDNAGAMTDFVQRAGVQGVTSLFGDYDGDGRTDVALLGAIKEGKVAWPIPVAFSTGRTGFKTNYKAEVVKTDASTGVSTVPQAELVRTWSTSSRKLMGDFDGDGRSDIALLVNSEEGLSAMPVLFSDFPSSEKWTLVDSQVGPFSSWCHSTKAAVGDFDGDGYSDIVCTGGSKWETVSDAIPVAYSTGRKGWKVEIGEAEKFISQAASEGTQMVLGDFDGDGKTDIAAIGSNMATIPVAFSNGRGQWASSVTPSSADVNGAIAGVAGDFDGDGKDDILLIGAGKATSSVTVLYSKGREGWTVRSEQVGSWAQQATLKGARYLVGDYDGDGRADVCLTGVAGWSELMFIYGKADSRGLVSSPQSAGVFASQAAQLSVKGDNLLQTEEIRSHLI
jgi:hypothetical protein